MPEFIEGAFRAAFFLVGFGRIVSLLAFNRRLPLASRPDATLSPWLAPRTAWGIEGTVSVSTVMFLEGISGTERGGFARSEEYEVFEGRVAAFCVDVTRWSSVLPLFSTLLGPLSLPLSAFVVLELRSSVILVEAGWDRSSSDDFAL